LENCQCNAHFKKGTSSSLGNYRPISLTSVFFKIYERVIKDQMLTYRRQQLVIINTDS